MRPTKVLQGKKAYEAMRKGVNTVYEPVKASFGPEGKNVLVPRTLNRGVRITNDGYTIAENIIPKNIFERAIATVFKEPCKRSNEKVGDGTSCAVILAGALFNHVFSALDQKSGIGTQKEGVITLKRKILESAKNVKQLIEKEAKKIKNQKDLEKIAIISVQDEELGKIIGEMAWKVGVEGHIDVFEGYKGIIETEVTKGMKFPAKIPARGFINSPKHFEMTAKDCPVLLTNYELDSVDQLGNAINPLLAKDPKLIIIAPKFSNDVLEELYKASYITQNGQKVKGKYDIYPVHAPALRTDQFEDMSVYFGARFIDKNTGAKLRNVMEKDLGFVEKLIVKGTENREDAIARGGAGMRTESKQEEKDGVMIEQVKKSAVQERIEILKGQLEETRQENFKNLMRRRIASMNSAIGLIRVGGATDAEIYYQKLKIEDAVNACKAALRKGYVKGGGLCLKEIADKLKDDDILKKVLIEPYQQIQDSMGGDFEIADDVIDPTEVVYYAVEHASEVISNLITVEAIIPEVEDPIHGEGEIQIAKAIHELNITERRHKGLMKENEEQIYRDTFGDLSDEEKIILDGDESV